jgi:hypothetical protein
VASVSTPRNFGQSGQDVAADKSHAPATSSASESSRSVRADYAASHCVIRCCPLVGPGDRDSPGGLDDPSSLDAQTSRTSLAAGRRACELTDDYGYAASSQGDLHSSRVDDLGNAPEPYTDWLILRFGSLACSSTNAPSALDHGPARGLISDDPPTQLAEIEP